MTINFDDLDKLIHLAERADIEALEVVDGDQRIHIVCRPIKSGFLSNDMSSSQSHPFATMASTATQENEAQTQGDADVGTLATNTDNNENSEKKTVDAPMMGTFYRRPEPNSDEFVHKGDTVNVGDSLCVIEAMKIMHEVKAQSAGIIADVLVAEGDVVEFGQPLFVLA